MAPAKPPRWTEYVDLDEVLRAPRNPKSHNAQIISASMSRFGVVELPTVDERTGRLVAGHGRLDEWERARTAGEDPPDGISVADDGGWRVPVNRGWKSRSDADAEAYLVVSNRSTELGGWDDAALADVLNDLREADLLEFTGYTEDDIDKLAHTINDAEAPDEFPSYDDATISTEHQCPSCGYKWSGSSSAKDEDDGSGFGPISSDD